MPILNYTPRCVDLIAFDSRLGNKWCVQVKRYSEDRKVTRRDVYFGVSTHSAILTLSVPLHGHIRSSGSSVSIE
ncbi:hypothetical protein [Stygiolobus sp. KN-1]|uniref:restriction endonuclease n=1 Tax=Stygiolobus caldivivus TaxID=2824673 RepID=UPI001C8550E8